MQALEVGTQSIGKGSESTAKRGRKAEGEVDGLGDVIDGLLGDPGVQKDAKRHKDRPTKEQMRERLDFVLLLMQRQAYKSDIKKLMQRRWPRMTYRTVERYMSRARGLLRKRYEKVIKEPRFDSILWWDSVIRGPDADLKMKAWAREQLDRRLGVDRPPEDIGQPAAVSSPPHVMEVVVSSRAEASEIIALSKSGQVVDAGNLRQLREGSRLPTIGTSNGVVGLASASPSEEVQLPAYEPVEVSRMISPSEEFDRNGYELPEDMVDPTIIVPD